MDGEDLVQPQGIDDYSGWCTEWLLRLPMSWVCCTSRPRTYNLPLLGILLGILSTRYLWSGVEEVVKCTIRPSSERKQCPRLEFLLVDLIDWSSMDFSFGGYLSCDLMMEFGCRESVLSLWDVIKVQRGQCDDQQWGIYENPVTQRSRLMMIDGSCRIAKSQRWECVNSVQQPDLSFFRDECNGPYRGARELEFIGDCTCWGMNGRPIILEHQGSRNLELRRRKRGGWTFFGFWLWRR